MAEQKKCPFNYFLNQTMLPCKGKECACWVELSKPSPNGNPYWHWEYEGCGLIQHLPWRHVKTEEQKK